MTEIWTVLAAFVFTSLSMVVLGHSIHFNLQWIGLRLLGSVNGAMIILYLLLFPGILLHEFSHWAMARFLRLKTAGFSVWPRRMKGYLRLGSVQVSSGGPFLDVLVGLAPFLVGSTFLLIIGYRVFEIAALENVWLGGQWQLLPEQLWRMAQVGDSWLWFYFIFAISNAMMPSASDRAAWKPVGLFLVLAAVILYITGFLPSVSLATAQVVGEAMRILTTVFLLALLVNFCVAIVLWTLRFVLTVFSMEEVVHS